MPLPAALAARLARRGIVAKPVEKKVEEEVFVEHYDENPVEPPTLPTAAPPSQPDVTHPIAEPPRPQKSSSPEPALIHEKRACPNQSNPYHECSAFCINKWGYSRFEPQGDMEKKKAKMLIKHPLPEGWMEVGDPGTHRYYYWNANTDQVSWMPPTHPRAVVTLPAEKLQASALLPPVSNIAVQDKAGSAGESDNDDDNDDNDDARSSRSSRKNSGSDSDSDSLSDSDDSDRDDHHSDMDAEDDFETLERQIMQEKEKKAEKTRNKQQLKRKREDPLDPMDPASYSDIPRGKWSDGLVAEGDAKSGVDSTATGPLFQQRPYPSPGDILRMNKK